jgi:hypothetical protein
MEPDDEVAATVVGYLERGRTIILGLEEPADVITGAS